jgi:tetratricopeptide (TPR) repeat protein/tRNA A-37 threonylcarbamoyl transferase component Bud32
MARMEARFTLEDKVGRGAFGEVFRARDLETGERVAVKRLHQSLDDDAALDRFRREARLLSILDDPHVVRYVDHGEDADGRLFLAVEWLEGEDLGKRQQRERLSFPEVIEAARQAALGLHALHEAGIVHRDIKPSNLFLVPGEGGALRIKLIDLGVARAGGESTLTTGAMAMGTPFYMSPEQARGRERVTHRSDLFSLGVVIFELCAGRRPYTGDHLFAVLAKIVLQEPPRLRDALPGAHPRLEALVLRAMSKSPEARFASAWEMAEALAALPLTEGLVNAAIRPDDSPTVGISSLPVTATEQRVVTAVFAALPAGAAAEPSARGFASIVEDQGGACHPTVDRHLIAVFGGAHSTGDEVMRAARAALIVADRLDGVRLSIVTGRALSGLTGLSGDAIERGAAEVEIRGAPGAAPLPRSPILLDEASALLLSEHFVVEQQGAKRLLQGPRATVAPPRTLVGRVTPCVGRERELAVLEAAFAACVAEPSARALLLTGPAGIGKSRLRYELLARLALGASPPTVLFGRAGPFTAESAYALLAQAIRRLTGVLDGESPVQQRGRLGERLRAHLPAADAQRVEPLIGELIGIPALAGDPPGPRADSVLAGDRLRAAFLEWIEAEAAAHPLLIVLEDLHWGDLSSVALIDAALRTLARRPLLVVALGRLEVHERFPRLWAQRGLQEMAVGPLGAQATVELVRIALGKAADAATVALVLGRAEGNAFYAEELIRAVAEGTRDALPDTVLGMVQARLDALGAEPKRILRAGSVFGAAFWRGGVAAVLGLGPDEAELEAAIDQLVSREVIGRREAASFPGEHEYTFRHALVREAAYAMLTDDDRLAYHRRAGTWLEGAGEVDPAALAVHFERGGDRAGAASFHRRAAKKALLGNDFAGAIAHAEQSLAADLGAEDRGAARLIQAEAHRFRAELSDAEARAEEAASLLVRGSAPWFQAVREAVAAAGRLGHLDRVHAWASAAITAEAEPGAEGAHLSCLVPAAVHFIYAGHLGEAARVSARVDRIVAEVRDRGRDLEPVVIARLHQLGAIRAQQAGDLETALAEQQAAFAAFQRAGDARNACLTLSNLAFVHAELGNLGDAEGALRRAFESAERMGLSTVAPLCLHNLGHVLASLGQLDEAREIEARAVGAFQVQGDPRLEAASRIHLSRIHALRGDFPAAEAEARFVAEAPAAPAPLRAGALAALSQALLAQDQIAEAVAAAEQAAALIAPLGTIEDFDALVRIAVADALEAAGRREEAKAAIAVALKRLIARADALRDPALRQRFLHAVPDNRRCVELGLRWGIR